MEMGKSRIFTIGFSSAFLFFSPRVRWLKFISIYRMHSLPVKRKGHFLLLEVVLAISLISIAVTPLLSLPSYFYRKEIKSLKKLEHARIKDCIFLEMLCQLPKVLREKPIPLSQREAIKDANKAPSFIIPPHLRQLRLGGYTSRLDLHIWYWAISSQRKHKSQLLKCKIFLKKPCSACPKDKPHKKSAVARSNLYKVFLQEI